MNESPWACRKQRFECIAGDVGKGFESSGKPQNGNNPNLQALSSFSNDTDNVIIVKSTTQITHMLDVFAAAQDTINYILNIECVHIY